MNHLSAVGCTIVGMKKTVEGQIDALAVTPSTGEATTLLGGITVDVNLLGYETLRNGKGRKRVREDRQHMIWGLVDPNRMGDVALRGQESKVFWKVAGAVNPDTNIAAIGPTQLAELLGITRQAASNQLRELRRRRLLIRVGQNQWRINYWLWYRGSVTEWETLTLGDPEPEFEYAS